VEWNFGDVFLTMFVFFFWVLYIWMFIATFSDIFRRHDMSNWAKAGWILLTLVLPVIGILAYVVARPKVTAEEVYGSGRSNEVRGYGQSSADEIAKLVQLHEDGALSDIEYERLRSRAVV
jgi:hypothetical protein